LAGFPLPFLFGGIAIFKRFLISAVCLSSMACSAYANPTWITQEFQGGVCKVIETGGENEDWWFGKCKSFPNVSTWSVYTDSVHLHVGFGKLPNTALPMVSAKRGNWPIEWGGERKAGKFVPLVAIGRFAYLGNEPIHTRLFVFRLLANGMSCVVGDFATNIEAKSAANAAMKTWQCASQPEPIELK
jgi:hypothetical protein